MRAILISLLLAVAATAQPAPAGINFWTDLGIRAYNAAHYEEADSAFRRVLNLDPKNLTALAYLASVAFNQKRMDEAMAWNDRVIQIDPENKEAFYSKGVIAWRLWYPSLLQARRSLKMKPEDPGPLLSQNIRNDLRARFGDLLDRGITDLKRAIEIDPQYEDAFQYLHLLIRERADLADTREEYRQQIELADESLQKALALKRLKAQRPVAERNTGVSVSAAAMERRLVHKVDPVYSADALRARIQGIVLFAVIVGPDGRIENLQLVSGHPMLVPSALAAAKQYEYEPTLVSGAPVRVVTTLEIRFTLP
ncbi:MAG TPA: TonB family protein [Bryobacteraceae bacterium]|nr:TonB family protein [Bryobacteraceae bacterium]